MMSQHEKFLTWGLILLLATLIVATFLLGSVPPVDRDALTHHLFVPKLWVQHGGIYEIPEIPFSYYPMNLDLLYAIPLYFGNDIIPKYIHYLFALLTAGLIFNYLKKNLSVHYGLFGTLFFLSIPIIVKLSITVYVDLGLVFFTTASLLLLLHWAERKFQWRFLILAGLCCGLAAGVKYNGLVALVTLTLLVPILYQRNATKGKESNFRALLSAGVFAVAVLTVFSPWLARNYLWTGNPVYPLLKTFFHRLQDAPSGQQPLADVKYADTLQSFTQSGDTEFTARKTYYNETWWQTLLLPIRYFYQGQDDNPQYFDGKLTPFLLILPVLGFFIKPPTRQQQRDTTILLLFALIYFFLTFFQSALRIRYIVPIAPPLVILSMYGLNGTIHTITTRISSDATRTRVSFIFMACIVGLMLGYNAQYIAGQFTVVQPLAFLRGAMSRDDYISAFRPEYSAIQFLNSIVSGTNTKVLCLFLGNRGYFMDFQPVFEVPYTSSSILTSFLATENTKHTVVGELLQRNINYILLRTDLTAQWLRQLSEHDRQRLAPLFSFAEQPLWSGQGFVVLNIGHSTE